MTRGAFKAPRAIISERKITHRLLVPPGGCELRDLYNALLPERTVTVVSVLVAMFTRPVLQGTVDGVLVAVAIRANPETLFASLFRQRVE
jgi:hypothetical protein